jgi:hypothetical protein
MKSSDIALSILIVLLFFILYFVNVLAIDFKDIQKNWPLYRCNPTVMPFVDIIGPEGTNSVDNFVYCVQNMQKNYMPNLLEGVNYNFDLLSNVSLNIKDSLYSAVNFISEFRKMISDNISNVFGIFSNLVVEIQRTTITIKDTFSKLIGIIGTMVFLLDGSMKTSSSIWNGPPGSMIRGVAKIKIPNIKICFHPHTLIQKEDRTFCKIEDIKLGDVIKNNSTVIAVLKINNLSFDKKIIKKFHKFQKEGEREEDIYVTGCHLVFDDETNNFVKVKNHKKSIKTNESNEYFTCLITSNHIISIGNYIFHDWEDNNGSISKY